MQVKVMCVVASGYWPRSGSELVGHFSSQAMREAVCWAQFWRESLTSSKAQSVHSAVTFACRNSSAPSDRPVHKAVIFAWRASVPTLLSLPKSWRVCYRGLCSTYSCLLIGAVFLTYFREFMYSFCSRRVPNKCVCVSKSVLSWTTYCVNSV